MRRTSTTDYAITAFAPIVWGSTYLVTTEFLPPDRPLLAAVVRALPAGLLLMVLTRTLPHGIWWIRSAVLGALNIGIFFFLLFVAAYQLPGGVAALVMSVQPLIVLLLGVSLLGQRILPIHLVACAIGTAGIALLVLRSNAQISTLGVAAGLLGALSMAAGIVLAKRWGRPPGTGILGFTGVQLFLGGLLLVPPMLIVEGLPAAVTTRNIGGFAYLAVIGALIAYAVWFRGIERLPAVVVSFLGFLSPVTAVALGYVFLGEDLTAWQIVGACAVIASIALIQFAFSRQHQPPAGHQPGGPQNVSPVTSGDTTVDALSASKEKAP